jgi:hypothetical protein
MKSEKQENLQAKAAGYSAKKEHWQVYKIHGVNTSCKKRLSYSGNSNEQFKFLMEKYPEDCCKKCSEKFTEYQKINKKVLAS